MLVSGHLPLLAAVYFMALLQGPDVIYTFHAPAVFFDALL